MPLFPPNDGVGLPQSVCVALTVDVTTTSTSYVNLLSVTVGTVGGSSLLIRASVATSDSTSLSTGNFFRVTVDGVVAGYIGSEIFTCIQSSALSVKVGPLAAGSHVVNLDWHTQTGNTLRCRPVTAEEQASMVITEVTV